ncbi:hypothetical protein AB6Q56_14425 [Dechloromonas sp. ARDL1]|uniref:hypothetical protein n=1 Tax=Dechloromonas sp. ARDL1 TaxID=3322121 RepID=UPI003DA7A4CF
MGMFDDLVPASAGPAKRGGGLFADLIAPKYDPTEGMSTSEKFLAGVGKAMTDAGRGVGQMVGLVSQDEINEAKALDKPLMNTTAGTVGNVVGNIATLAPTMLVPGANTVGGAALINGLAGGVLTPGSVEDRAQAAGFGALGGAAGVGAAKLIAGTGKAVSAAAAPFSEDGRKKIIGEVMRRAAGDNADSVAARMSNAQEIIPGSLPTAAEVAESGGIAALQRAMSAANPEAYAHRGMSNNAARVEALRGIAKDEQAMQQAIAARRAASDPLYAAADNAVVTSDAALRDIMSRLPNGTLEQAQNIARMTGKPIQFGKDVPESMAYVGGRAESVPGAHGHAKTVQLPGLLDANGSPITRVVPEQKVQYTGRGLDLIKKAIDDVVNVNPTAPIAKNARGQAVGVKNDLVSWADANIPEYAAARQAWAEGSVPITQMQVGQALLNKIEPALVQYHPSGVQFRQAGGAYANALNDVRGNLVKNATGGMKRNLEDVMTPEQMQTLNGIAADLSRSAAASDMGRGVGSNTFQNFAMDNLASQVGMPSAVSAIANLVPGLGKVSAVGKALGNTLYKSKDELMKAEMADLLLNPKAAAEVMNNAALKAKYIQALVDKFGPDGVQRAIDLGLASPGLLGASFALPNRGQ